MTIRVLIVDDSTFFRQQIKAAIDAHPKLRTVGEATNGREAIEKTQQLKPDVITMDYEMPLMDGITAVKEIMAQQPTPILMFSSLTLQGARVTLDALDAGAVDFLPKNYQRVKGSNIGLNQVLIEKIIALAGADDKAASAAPERPAPKRYPQKFELVLIGTSTGGPVALQTVLKELPRTFPTPILMIQHMPGSFTTAFAERLNAQCAITVKEAGDGEVLEPGTAYLAPGGQQMMLTAKGRLKIFAGDERLHYKPSVDLTFGSAVKHYRDRSLAIVLTGMGADGCDGSRLLKQVNSVVWAQEGKTCVVDGMPAAVVKANLSDEVIALQDIAGRLKRVVV